MDLKHIVILALQVSILATVFGFGLKTTLGDLTALLRRPGLLVRSVLAVFVVMPIVAFLLVRLFDLQPTIQIALMALAISPVPPILPQREIKAGGDTSYALGLVAILSILAVAIEPLELDILEWVTGRPLSIGTEVIARIVAVTVLLPLSAGVAVRAFLPHVAATIEKPMAAFAKILLSAGVLVLIPAAAPAMWALVGNGTLVAMVLFLAVGLAIGHELGGPDPDHSVVLALSTACRHPAIALTVASTNFPDQHVGAAILLYILVGFVAAFPYITWQRRQMRPAPRPA